MEMVENMKLLRLAESRMNDHATPLEDFIKEEGFSMEELKNLTESVEFE